VAGRQKDVAASLGLALARKMELLTSWALERPHPGNNVEDLTGKFDEEIKELVGLQQLEDEEAETGDDEDANGVFEDGHPLFALTM
jgi:hypothetical protein